MGAPAPFDVQVIGTDLDGDYSIAKKLAAQFRLIHGVADVYVPQDIDYPSLQMNIDRTRAAELGLTEKEVFVERHHLVGIRQNDQSELLDRSEDWKQLLLKRSIY